MYLFNMKNMNCFDILGNTAYIQIDNSRESSI